jgi:HSP20 family protein
MRMRYRYVTYRYIDGSRQQLQRLYQQLLQDALRQSQQALLLRSEVWRPPVDIRESAERVVVKIELAGMSEDEINVTLYEDALVVSGERRDDGEDRENLYYQEAQIRYGPFRVEVFIPSPVDREAVTARYENGFLWVTLPKLPETRREPQRVPVWQSAAKE